MPFTEPIVTIAPERCSFITSATATQVATAEIRLRRRMRSSSWGRAARRTSMALSPRREVRRPSGVADDDIEPTPTPPDVSDELCLSGEVGGIVLRCERFDAVLFEFLGHRP